MKTTTVARGFIGAVASLLGVVAVGCSAGGWDEGAAGEGEIGSVAEALSIANISTIQDLASIDADPNTGGTQTAAGREFAASCKITDSYNDIGGNPVTRELMLVAGGYNNTGAALSDVYGYDNVDNRWIPLTSLPAARGEAKMVKLSSTQCLLAGGFSHKVTSPSALTQALIYDTATDTWVQAGVTPGVVKFGFSKCGTGTNAILIGGENTSRAAQNVMKVYNGETGTTAWGNLVGPAPGLATRTLNDPRLAFAMATENNQDFFIHSGWDGSGQVNSIETFSVSTACAAASAPAQYAITGGGSVGGLTRFGHVAFPTGTANEFAVVAGDSGSLTRQLDVYDVNFNSSVTRDAVKSNATSLGANRGVRFPTLIEVSASTWLLVGGEDSSSATLLGASPVAFVHEYVSGALSASTDLAVPRLGASGEYLSTPAKAYAAFGKSTSSHLTTAEEITP